MSYTDIVKIYFLGEGKKNLPRSFTEGTRSYTEEEEEEKILYHEQTRTNTNKNKISE